MLNNGNGFDDPVQSQQNASNQQRKKRALQASGMENTINHIEKVYFWNIACALTSFLKIASSSNLSRMWRLSAFCQTSCLFRMCLYCLLERSFKSISLKTVFLIHNSFFKRLIWKAKVIRLPLISLTVPCTAWNVKIMYMMMNSSEFCFLNSIIWIILSVELEVFPIFRLYSL